MSGIVIAIYVLATSLALIFLKWGAKAGAPVEYLDGKMHFNINAYVLSGVALYGVGFLVYMYLVSKYEIGYIIPLTTAIVYVLILTASYFIFDERFTPLKLIGITFIVLGLI
jgi:drug/metabolite transporter (DMT)-like permease